MTYAAVGLTARCVQAVQNDGSSGRHHFDREKSAEQTRFCGDCREDNRGETTESHTAAARPSGPADERPSLSVSLLVATSLSKADSGHVSWGGANCVLTKCPKQTMKISSAQNIVRPDSGRAAH